MGVDFLQLHRLRKHAARRRSVQGRRQWLTSAETVDDACEPADEDHGGRGDAGNDDDLIKAELVHAEHHRRVPLAGFGLAVGDVVELNSSTRFFLASKSGSSEVFQVVIA